MAVVSDLHCHASIPGTRDESFVTAAAPRSPAGRHPVQALIALIRASSLKADALLCPGDLANKICQQGMMQAFDHLRELNGELRSEQLVVTLGNHDVDCKRNRNPNPFEVPRNLHPEFPHADVDNQRSFWSDGYYFAAFASGTEVLVLNTVVDHHDEISAKRGTFDANRLDVLKRALEQRYGPAGDPQPNNIRIALLHHHPVLHSSVTFGSADVLQFGDQLLDLLCRFGFRIAVHGHRHDPRITRQVTPNGEAIVFAAGSFSALLQELSSTTRNLFHLLEIELAADLQLRGVVRTWEYGYGLGWRPASPRSAKLPFVLGFASPPVRLDPSLLMAACLREPGSVLRGQQLVNAVPGLYNLLPEEIQRLQSLLQAAGMKLTLTEEGEIESMGIVQPV